MFDVYVDTNPANFVRQGSKVFSVWSATGTNGAVDMEFDRLTLTWINDVPAGALCVVQGRQGLSGFGGLSGG